MCRKAGLCVSWRATEYLPELTLWLNCSHVKMRTEHKWKEACVILKSSLLWPVCVVSHPFLGSHLCCFCCPNWEFLLDSPHAFCYPPHPQQYLLVCFLPNICLFSTLIIFLASILSILYVVLSQPCFENHSLAITLTSRNNLPLVFLAFCSRKDIIVLASSLRILIRLFFFFFKKPNFSPFR